MKGQKHPAAIWCQVIYLFTITKPSGFSNGEKVEIISNL